MGIAILVEYYSQLPQPREGEESRKAVARYKAALEKFKKLVRERYTEGTLQRLLDNPNPLAREAAVFAMGMLGTMSSNEPLAARLRDDSPAVRQLAAESLWSLWFSADSANHNQELQRLVRQRDPMQTLTGLDALVKRSPGFAEAYNQRAIVYFRLKEYQKSALDCERVLKLNPYHFGAQAGLAQCYMKLSKPRAALKAFRHAYRMNPDLEGVAETIKALESALGEEGRKDDKK